MGRNNMRLILAIVFSVLITALAIFAIFASRSKKAIGGYVSFVVASIIMPILGNLMIILASTRLTATIGYYVYFIGMDVAAFSILFFAHAYCDLRAARPLKIAVYTFLILDVIHFILNPFLGFSFATEMIAVEDSPYFRLIPYIGQTYHRVGCYGIILIALIIFIRKAFKTPKIYAEKYWSMAIAILITMVVESYYIFSRHPMDISMIGLGVFGILVYFFAFHYRSMKLLDRMLASIASDTSDSLFFFDKGGNCIWTNEHARTLVGIDKNNFDNVKDNLTFLFGDIDFRSTGWFKRVTLGTGDEEQYTYLAMHSVVDDKGNVTGSYLSVRDITEEQNEMKREMYNSTHDALTGLYTKEYLFELIDQRLERDKKTDYIICYIEVTNYKIINDVFGRKFGENTIKHIAEFIRTNAFEKALYGQLSDDAFGVMTVRENFNKEDLSKRLEAFTIKDNNLEHHILVNFGVYEINDDDENDVALFFDCARLATTMRKDKYTDLIAFYDDNMRNEIIHNQLISNQLHDAIRTRQIRPYLQPIVDSRGMLVGAEALVRWIHPDQGFMSPGDFIPVFERNGLIATVDRYMWRCACEILSDWKARGINAFISVNISPKDFYFMDVTAELANLIEEFGIEPVKLRIEITETVMITDSINITDIINRLRDFGFIVEMDDFGSGYSSLNLLKDINIDVIKIDMQFLRDSERNWKANTIINNIINMSKDLEMDTLTEGVETAKQFENLFAMGCKLYQGYYFSKPVPREDFEKQWFD